MAFSYESSNGVNCLIRVHRRTKGGEGADLRFIIRVYKTQAFQEDGPGSLRTGIDEED